MDPLSWIIIGICVFLHFFFSASETALASANKFKFQVKADDGSKTSKLVLKVCDDYDRILSTLLIGSNIVAILASSVSTIAFYNLFIDLGIAVESVSLISSIIISLLIYIFGDALAKTIAKSIPDTVSTIVVYPAYVFSIIFFPLSWCFDKLAYGFDKLFKVKEEESITEDEFEDVIDDVTDDGVLEEETSEIIQINSEKGNVISYQLADKDSNRIYKVFHVNGYRNGGANIVNLEGYKVYLDTINVHKVLGAKTSLVPYETLICYKEKNE